jgi:hypothetical protein
VPAFVVFVARLALASVTVDAPGTYTLRVDGTLVVSILVAAPRS